METSSTTSEQIFFQDHNVTVTQARFMVDGKTYAMRNISSVSNFRIRKNRVFPVIITAIGILCLFGSTTLQLGLLLTPIGGVWWFLINDEYTVRINSNSGESNAYRSKDRDYIQRIVDAVGQAIVFRG